MIPSTNRTAKVFLHGKMRGKPAGFERDNKKGCTKSQIREKNDSVGKTIETGLILPRPAQASFQGKTRKGPYPHAP
jgi:hypothetical protein